MNTLKMCRYVFLCDSCEWSQEIYASIKDGPPLTYCSQCNAKMCRDYSQAEIELKSECECE
jgi:predicted nucleic acid-binding Zn ribbon protein